MRTNASERATGTLRHQQRARLRTAPRARARSTPY